MFLFVVILFWGAHIDRSEPLLNPVFWGGGRQWGVHREELEGKLLGVPIMGDCGTVTSIKSSPAKKEAAFRGSPLFFFF